jgi:hypothetical protein
MGGHVIFSHYQWFDDLLNTAVGQGFSKKLLLFLKKYKKQKYFFQAMRIGIHYREFPIFGLKLDG